MSTKTVEEPYEIIDNDLWVRLIMLFCIQELGEADPFIRQRFVMDGDEFEFWLHREFKCITKIITTYGNHGLGPLTSKKFIFDTEKDYLICLLKL